MQVNPKIELTFASGLRSILRQDPDVIMVGEIRDSETAEIAIQAALTGHLVFSTLHTNDSFGALTRLVDMGIEPFLVSSSILAVLAQRLVRMVCPDCREPYTPTPTELSAIGYRRRRPCRDQSTGRRQRMPRLPQHRLPRPYGDSGTDGDGRRDPQPGDAEGGRGDDPARLYRPRDEAFAAGRRGAGSCGRNHDRRTACASPRKIFSRRLARSSISSAMPVFAYRGLSANGRSVAGVVDADSARTARGKLRERGIFPTEI